MKFRTVVDIAKRFLMSKSSDGFISLITWVSATGVALGVLSLTVVTSVMNGFEGELAKVIAGLNGDIVLYSYSDPVTNGLEIESKIKEVIPETLAITSSLIGQMMASNGAKVAGVVLEGINPETIQSATRLLDKIYEGRFAHNKFEIVLTESLAEKLNAKVNSKIKLIIPVIGDGVEQQSAPQLVEVTVVGLAKLGMYEYDSKYAFSDLTWLQEMLNLKGAVSTFKIKIKEPNRSYELAQNLSDAFSYPFRAKDWSMLNKNLFYAIQLEKIVIAIILLIIIIVAAFNIVSTLMMLIHDKAKEIAILKSMGLRKKDFLKLFTLIGVFMGVVGVSIGLFTGLGINFILSESQIIKLPSDIYYISYLPVIINWNEVLLIVLSTLVITLFATLGPSIKVARQTPMKGILDGN